MLLREKVGSLRAALDTATKRRSRKRRYVQTEETLTVGEVQEVVAEQADSSRGGGKCVEEGARREAMRALQADWTQRSYLRG